MEIPDKVKIISAYALISILILGLWLAYLYEGNNSTSHLVLADTAADSALSPDLLGDDGPYVFWASQSSVKIFYDCEGELIMRNLEIGDTASFYGFCSDSLSTYSLSTRPPEIEPYIYENAPRIIALSDIHGEYDELVEILINSQVIDDRLHWLWGDGHLVINGDIFDRGDQVTECIWLIHRLEKEAKQSGGRVHWLLGNHDVMPMLNDLRYVNEKYSHGIVKLSRISYEDLFGPEMELGRWLRTKQTIIKINNILFVHAGISPEMIDRNLTMADINKTIRENLDTRSYYHVFDDKVNFLFKSYGPLWYRGLVTEDKYPRATLEDVIKVLEYFNAEAIVIGHSEVDQIESFYDGRVFAIDVPVEDLGSQQALLWENGKFYRVMGTGKLERLR